jgi:HD superfamily phosphodiesterase
MISYSTVPDSQLAKAVAEFIWDTESELLFNHSTRVYLWGELTGQRKSLTFDRELLYVGAMFHDIGLTERYCQSQLRFEVDGANAARTFLRTRGIDEQSVEIVWDAMRCTPPPEFPNTRKQRSRL